MKFQIENNSMIAFPLPRDTWRMGSRGQRLLRDIFSGTGDKQGEFAPVPFLLTLSHLSLYLPSCQGWDNVRCRLGVTPY